MKIVDNWKSIREHLDFSDPDKFYFIELMQRKKDVGIPRNLNGPIKKRLHS